MWIDVSSTVILTSFLEIEGNNTLIGVGEWGNRDSKENWQVIRAKVLKHLQRAGKGERWGSEGDIRREAAGKETVQKSWSVRIIEGKEIRRDSPIEYFFPTRVWSISCVAERVMIVRPRRKKRFWRKGVQRKKRDRFFCRSIANKISAYFSKTRGGVFQQGVDPYLVRVEINQRGGWEFRKG